MTKTTFEVIQTKKMAHIQFDSDIEMKEIKQAKVESEDDKRLEKTKDRLVDNSPIGLENERERITIFERRDKKSNRRQCHHYTTLASAQKK